MITFVSLSANWVIGSVWILSSTVFAIYDRYTEMTLAQFMEDMERWAQRGKGGILQPRWVLLSPGC